KQLCMHPLIFNDILDQISDHLIFQNQSNNKQLPIAIQLSIFLNHAGHYGNAYSLDDIGQWAGVSVRTVINCTHHVMAAILNQHDKFLYIPEVWSKEMQQAQSSESQTCQSWRNGVFAADGSAINLFAKPGLYGETFYDQKSNCSLNCQVRQHHFNKLRRNLLFHKLVIMPHNLMIANYALGQPRSVHDAYAFQNMHIAKNHETLILWGHWMWADTAYPTEKWCVVPFKKPQGG
ncbi:hypothetical protein PAXRUDRAFT_132042, partial [Paxillus rubicundulus Ve08.2h10]